MPDEPSQNHCNFYDNRVLPQHADSDVLKFEAWWFQPEVMFKQRFSNLGAQAQRVSPVYALAEILDSFELCLLGRWKQRVSVDISLDEGKTWKMTDLVRPGDCIAIARGFDKRWCWVWCTAVASDMGSDEHAEQMSLPSKRACIPPRLWQTGSVV